MTPATPLLYKNVLLVPEQLLRSNLSTVHINSKPSFLVALILIWPLRSHPDILSATIGSGTSRVLDRTRPGECIFGEGSGERLLAADLLTTDEALDGDGDGAVDVSRTTVVG